MLTIPTIGCGNCKWFRRMDGEDWGECYLNPPIAVLESEFEEDEECMTESRFQVNLRPQVDTVDICKSWESLSTSA